MAEIILEGVTKRFPDGTEPLRDATFTIRDGELFILVGPSGCGKSTLLNMIIGLEEISDGEIRVDGVRVNELDPKDRNMAMVFQSYAIYPHMTVRENIAFPLRMAKVPPSDIEERVSRAASALALDAVLERRPATLSGGQRQRVAMGRAIVREPKAFLLDEPLSNLDAKLRVQMRTEIARLQKRLHTTMIYVTHDQTEAMTLGDRVAVLDRGRIQQIDTPRVLYDRPANLFVASFLGSPPMNFMPAAVDGERIVLPGAEFDPPAAMRQSLKRHSHSLIAGIRPEHFHPVSPGAPQPRGKLIFDAKADVVEWLGADTLIHWQVAPPFDRGKIERFGRTPNPVNQDGTIPLVARLDPTFPVQEGDKLNLCVDTCKVRWFDGDTGLSIQH